MFLSLLSPEHSIQPFKWPERESLWHTMPQCFQQSFGKKVTVIIDCFEIFIDSS